MQGPGTPLLKGLQWVCLYLIEKVRGRILAPKLYFQRPSYAVILRGMSIDQIVAEALRLPANERAILAESLWESLGDPFKAAAENDEAATAALALERDRQVESGEVQPLSHEQLMSRLRHEG